jgi:DNA-directed RNA polymerase specialized sigma24 family protein
MTVSPLPTREQELELHRRLRDRDRTAPVDLADAYHTRLMRHLRRKNSALVSEDLLSDAVYETWANLCKNPDSYEGSRSLWSYLQMSAQGDLVNAIAKEARHRRRVQIGKNVELCAEDGMSGSADDPEAAAEREAEAERVRREILPRVKDSLSPEEVVCLDLLLAGEKKTARFAAALGVTNLSPKDQKDRVKQTKDKLKLRIRRARGEP